MTPDHLSVIGENASRLRALHADLDAAVREDFGGPRYQATLRAFDQHYDRLAFPGGLERGLANLKTDDSKAVESAVCFLEANPLFFRSGFIKEEIIRRLKHVTLTHDQKTRLTAVVLRSLSGRWQMPRRMARLAPRVDSPSFRKQVEAAAESSSEETRLRALRMLQVLRSAKT